MNEMNDMNEYKPREVQTRYQTDADDTPIGFVALWRLLWRNKLRILMPAILLSLLAAYVVTRSSDTYTAEAQIILTRGNLEIIEVDGVNSSELTSGAIANAMTILNSRSLAVQVVDRLDLVNDPEINPLLSETFETGTSWRDWLSSWTQASDEEDVPVEVIEQADEATLARQFALEWLGESTAIVQLPGTNVGIIRATTSDPIKSAAVANAYAENYLEYQLSFSLRQVQRATDALADRVGELRLRVQEDQRALQDFGSSSPTISLDSLPTLVSQANNIRVRLQDAQERLSDLNGALAKIDGLENDPSRDGRAEFNADPLLTEMETTVAGGAIAAAELRSRLPDIRARAIEQRDQAVRLEAALRESLQSLDERIVESNDFEIGYRELEVELETTSQVYETSLARLKELIIQSGVRDAGAQILAPAEVPLRYDIQGRRRLVVIAFILGLLLGSAYVLARESTNDRVRKTSDLEDASGAYAVVDMPKLRRGFWRRDLQRNVSLTEGRSLFFEGVRTLRQSLIKSGPPRHGGRVIGVFSGLPREGKSLVSVALARSFAMMGHSVLLIDTDLRSSSLHRTLTRGTRGFGLQDGLGPEPVELSQLVVSQPTLRFDVIFAGKSTRSPADLLASENFAKLISEAREQYDFVILDTPPILVVPDASQIAQHSDQQVLVAEYDRSPMIAVRDAASILRNWGSDEVIAVLYSAPQVFGQQYGIDRSDFSRYLKS